ncbi:MAG: ABC transporter permease [Paracoccaceae bacterium]|nr:ABC transporter permease [Paracoccaceae bacterium]
MPVWEIIADGARSIRAHALRSLLATLGIIIGTASLIAMLAVGAGAQARIAAQIGTLGAHVVMAIPGAERDAGRAVRPIALTLNDTRAIEADVPEVVVAAPALQGRARLIAGNRNHAVRINGTSADYFPIRDWPIATGRAFSRREEARAGKVVVLGATAARRLFGEAYPVGREIRVLNTPMQVIGVLARKGESGAGRDQDDVAFVPFATARLRLGAEIGATVPGAVSYILAKTTAAEHVAPAGDAINALLRQRHRVAPGAEAGFRVTDPAAAIAAQRGSERTIGWLLAAIASISLVVGGIGIMNIMLVSVAERTREIGLRLAIGARRRDIARLFLAEALIVCLTGGTIGVAVGLGASEVLAHLAGWPMLVAPNAALAALAFSAGIGITFGFYPALKASRLPPAQALRAS